MTLPTATKNNLLGGQTFTDASLHTAFPGTTGANEVTGGGIPYARKTITVNAASGGVRSLNAAVTFNVPACIVRWLGFYNGGAFVAGVPNGGATPKNFMAVPATSVVWVAGHGWSDSQKITFFQGVPPAPLIEGTTYFVRDAGIDSFKVAATAGGVAITLSAASSYGCVVSAISEDEYLVDGTHSLTAATVTIPD